MLVVESNLVKIVIKLKKKCIISFYFFCKILFDEDVPNVFLMLVKLNQVHLNCVETNQWVLTVSGEILYMLCSSLSFSLWLIFRKSLDENIYPDLFKLSTVMLVLKSSDGFNVTTNYRLVSILSHIIKLLESLVFYSTKPAVNLILIDEQHGFRPGRSTTTSHLVFTNYIFYAFTSRSQVDVIYYTDFTKAFDSVDHHLLSRILFDSGFGVTLLSWFSSYLHELQATCYCAWCKI